MIRRVPAKAAEMYLSFDSLDLILKTGDHAVQLSHLGLGCAQVFSISSGWTRHLLVLFKIRNVCHDYSGDRRGDYMGINMIFAFHSPSVCTSSRLQLGCGWQCPHTGRALQPQWSPCQGYGCCPSPQRQRCPWSGPAAREAPAKTKVELFISVSCFIQHLQDHKL